eukprot:TRINITY_DN2506_c0_g2_i1.p3 TRINITY_DN2506_c0_g2~~TRINITY_DN2506_c0_g2_i1.p3  ORF type:complete len:338 (-),score=118.73 TRINITY_DN2506_c0_g2_i1:2808-3821(-)
MDENLNELLDRHDRTLFFPPTFDGVPIRSETFIMNRYRDAIDFCHDQNVQLLRWELARELPATDKELDPGLMAWKLPSEVVESYCDVLRQNQGFMGKLKFNSEKKRTKAVEEALDNRVWESSQRFLNGENRRENTAYKGHAKAVSEREAEYINTLYPDRKKKQMIGDKGEQKGKEKVVVTWTAKETGVVTKEDEEEERKKPDVPSIDTDKVAVRNDNVTMVVVVESKDKKKIEDDGKLSEESTIEVEKTPTKTVKEHIHIIDEEEEDEDEDEDEDDDIVFIGENHTMDAEGDDKVVPVSSTTQISKPMVGNFGTKEGRKSNKQNKKQNKGKSKCVVL